MANIKVYIDTNKLRNNGNQIKRLANELNTILDTMFNRIEKMPTSTKEWTGNSALKFANIAKRDKAQYYELKREIEKYGTFLCDSASKLENRVRNLDYL